MADMKTFVELSYNNPVHINADNVKAVRDNPDDSGKSSWVEMMDGKIIYVLGNHADVAKKLSS